MAHFHDRHTAALVVEHFFGRLLQYFCRQRCGASRKIMGAMHYGLRNSNYCMTGNGLFVAVVFRLIVSLLSDALNTIEHFIFFQIDQPHTLSIATDYGHAV